MNKRRKQEQGKIVIGMIGVIILIPIVLIVAAIGWYVYYEARKAYWDHQVKQMCEKDGGVHILERVNISKSDIDLLGRNNGKISVPIKSLAPPNAPVYSESTTRYLRKSDPEIWRREEVIKRRADQTIVALWVFYSRVGGDFPTFANPSYFGCPELNRITSDLEHLFIVEGNTK